MDDSINQLLKLSYSVEDSSIFVSDSDEDVNESIPKEDIFVIESSENSVNSSPNLTPIKPVFSTASRLLSTPELKQRIKEHIPHYPDNEYSNDNIKDSFVSRDSIEGSDECDRISDDETDETSEDCDKMWKKDGCVLQGNIFNTLESRLDDNCFAQSDETNSDDAAISLAKQEIGVGNINPLVAQERALLVCKRKQLQKQLTKMKLLLTSSKIEFSDSGQKLRESIALQERQINEISIELENTSLAQIVKPEPNLTKEENIPLSIKEKLFHQEDSYYDKDHSPYVIGHDPTRPTSSDMKELGKRAQATLNKELSLTADRLQDMHKSLVARPMENERVKDPEGLKIKLMPHQQHALAWMLWREQQRPHGGVLADDMGLGKTLSMISLIIVGVEKKKLKEEEQSSDDEWIDHNTSLRYNGGTLVVCPASLLSQWENEIRNRCKRGVLSVEVYHGSKRENVPKRLARNDIVITTYNILSRECKTKSTLYRIHWERVILDEAHIIRNHKSQAAEAACSLVAKKRWALTGTPIQNKEMDLYPILKFIKCSPFDDLRVWKRWVDNKNAAGRDRLATLMNTLMLRRTKQELQDKGMLESLPEKFTEEIFVKLEPEEQLVYGKVLVYSRTLFAQFLAQRAEKNHMADLASGIYDKPSYFTNPNKSTQFTKAQNKLLSLHADVKTHEILVLLLRLRQICVHPSLIDSMLDQEDMAEAGLEESMNLNSDLISQIANMSLNNSTTNDEKANELEVGVDRRVATNVLTSKNPVFKPDRMSSKVKMVLDKIDEILEKGDKMIIVSQWTSLLNIVASFLSTINGATYEMFTGCVPIKKRQDIIDSFNAVDSDPKILLLSLTAGGVGLNLVGANHLLLIDIHWNPQLELQAQDRIYRFGQKKNVFIYKFICKETIEERIKKLQEKKLSIAQTVLSGNTSVAASKLTLDDLKSLFAL